MSANQSIADDSSSDAAAYGAARAMCRRLDRRFSFACAFLPRPKRDAACAAFAFCRLIQDAFAQTDEPGEGLACCGDSADGLLAMLRDRLDAMYADRLELPLPEHRDESRHVLAAAAHTLRRYEIPRELPLSLAQAYRANASVRRYATWTRASEQCARTSGTVLRILAAVLGLQHSDAARQMETLGVAMRWTEILRDLQPDAARGRVYLPLEDLARFRYSERELADGVVNDAFRALMKFQIDRARQLYRDGSAGICWLAGDGSRLMMATLAVMASGILNAIERMGFDVFAHTGVRPRPAQTLGRLPRAWRLARREADESMPDVFR